MLNQRVTLGRYTQDHRSAINYTAVLTEFQAAGAGYDPTQAWIAFYDALVAYNLIFSGTLKWSTDVRWN